MKNLHIIFTILSLSYISFSQIPQKDSSYFSTIRKPSSLNQNSSLDTLNLYDSKKSGINTESNAYKRVLADINHFNYGLKLKNNEKQIFYSEQEKLIKKNKDKKINTVAGWNWYERGPNNVGGRTRAFMFDPNDAVNGYKKVWAGSVGGGLWFNNDITLASSTWNKVNDFWDNLSISCISYDPQNKQKFYVGTGEGWFNIDYLEGAGIFATSNGGTSWNRLTSTIPNGTGITDYFKFVQKIVVNNTSEVFVATHKGLLKSNDSGMTWTVVLKPSSNIGVSGVFGSDFFSDLEIAADGLLYASDNSGKIYRSLSANGTVWLNITPPAVPTSYRTEIALAENTSGAGQNIYAISYSGLSSNVWMRRSIDAGTTWTDLTVPSIGVHSQGWYDLILKVHPSNENVIYAGAVGNVRSIDGGITWTNGLSVHTDHHNFIFRPGTNEMVDTQDGGVYYSPNWGDITIATPSAFSRNNGLNITQMYSVAQKNIYNDGYTIGGTQDNGTQKISTTYNTIGPANYVAGGDGMLCFIDQNEPNIQIGSFQYLEYYLVNGNGEYVQSLVSSGGGDFINPSDYDDRTNTLYIKYNQNFIKKVNGVGSTNTLSDTQLSPFGDYISFIKVANTANTLFIGTYGGNIYKVPNIDQSTASPTNLGNLGGQISSIDVGATDNILIATVSYYNRNSVFYSDNGGLSWINKDIGGIPNVPVRFATFFPYDNKKVVIATDLGVFYTPDITLPSFTWTEARSAATGANIGNVSCYWLKFRKNDGMLAVATHGRGIFFSDYFKSQVPLSINLLSTFNRNCGGGAISIKFEIQGNFEGASFSAQLSDASGNFTSPTTLGTVIPGILNTINIPNNISGAAYKIRVISSAPAMYSNESNTFEIVNVNFLNSTPSLVSVGSNGAIIKLSTNVSTTVFWVAVDNNQVPPSNIQIINGINFDGANTYSGSFYIDSGNTNRFLEINTLPGNANLDIYLLASECTNAIAQKLDIQTTGNAIAYCLPSYFAGGCANYEVQISSVSISRGATEILNRTSSTCSSGSFGLFLFPKSLVFPGDNLSFKTQHFMAGGNGYYLQNLSVWADFNRNGIYEASEQLFTTNYTSSPPFEYIGNFTIPVNITPGLLRFRFRTNSTCCGQVTDPCGNYPYGETEDYIISVGPKITTNSIAFTSAYSGNIVEIPFTSQGNFNNSNTFQVQFAPTNTGIFVNQNTTNVSSPLQATVNASLPTGEYLARVISTDPVVLGTVSNTTFIIMPPCPATIGTVTGIINSTIKYETAGNILSTQQLAGNAQVIYDAGTFIELNPGFDTNTTPAGYLTVQNDGCGGNLRKSAPKSIANEKAK